MANLTTRAGKGSPLSNNEVDANFNNLNTDKLETTATAADSALFGGELPSTFAGSAQVLKLQKSVKLIQLGIEIL